MDGSLTHKTLHGKTQILIDTDSSLASVKKDTLPLTQTSGYSLSNNRRVMVQLRRAHSGLWSLEAACVWSHGLRDRRSSDTPTCFWR